MSLWEDFKKFVFQGNIVDLAIAVVIGAAFNEFVTYLVDIIIMPLIGVLMKGVNYQGRWWQVWAAEVSYGMFIQSVLNFYLIASDLFIIIRFIIRKKQEEEEEPEVDPKEELLVEIRDLLKEQQMTG